MSGPDNRREPRAPIAVEVTLESEHNFYAGITDNVSRGGIFIATYTPPPAGALVSLELQLAGHEQPFSLIGRVLWVREATKASDFAPAGCGIRWVDLTPDAEKAIAGFVNKRDTIFFDDDE